MKSNKTSGDLHIEDIEIMDNAEVKKDAAFSEQIKYYVVQVNIKYSTIFRFNIRIICYFCKIICFAVLSFITKEISFFIKGTKKFLDNF